jgi:hypothetical protein
MRPNAEPGDRVVTDLPPPGDTPTPRPPPAPPAAGWWLASDGRWYPPEQAPGATAPPGPPGYGPPPGNGSAPGYPTAGYYANPYVQPAKTNGLAIASLVLGIIWIYWVGSILAVIFGFIALNQINRSQGREGGRGLAIAGIVLGFIGLGVIVLAIILVAAVGTKTDSRFSIVGPTVNDAVANARVLAGR